MQKKTQKVVPVFQIRAISSILLVLAVPTNLQSTTFSPCPNVLEYDTAGAEPGKWHGVVNVSTDSVLYSLWLNIVLDSKADILANWLGEVTTSDNIDYKIENTKIKIQPGPATPVKFFIRYNPLSKPPRVQSIRLNGREICNANIPRPVIDTPEVEVQPIKPGTTSLNSKPVSVLIDEIFRPSQTLPAKPINTKPLTELLNPVYTPTQTAGQSVAALNLNSNFQSINRPNTVYQVTTTPPRQSSSRPVYDPDYDDRKTYSNDYFDGRPPTFVVPANNVNKNRQQETCGKVAQYNAVPLITGGKPTLERQWPWQIALYQTQIVDNKYICGGTLVSRSHIITAAHCVTLKSSHRIVNRNTLTVYLGKHNLRTSVVGVQIRFVSDITVYPQYNATSYDKDLSILKLAESVQYTDWVRPACLWPDQLVNLNSVIGRPGSVVGWGFDSTGVASEELSLVEMPVVDSDTCLRSFYDFFVRFTSDTTYCAGYKNGASVCNGDSGGGMVFEIQGAWYLRGLVSLSVARNTDRCDPSHYVVFTDLAKFLPWIKETISQ